MADRRLRPVVRRGLIVAAAIAIAGGAAYGATFSWLFAAETVRVDGEVRISEDDVRRLGGIDVGVNLFHLDTSTVERRLLGDPRVADATVEIELPDLVTLRIVERIPIARVELDGRAAVVADDGTFLPGTPSTSLPEIRAVAGALDGPRRVAAARALAAMAPALRRSVATVFSAADGELVLETFAGVTVTYGATTEVGPKAAALRAVLGWAEEEDVAVTAIDVSVPNAPTARTDDGSVTPTSR